MEIEETQSRGDARAKSLEAQLEGMRAQLSEARRDSDQLRTELERQRKHTVEMAV